MSYGNSWHDALYHDRWLAGTNESDYGSSSSSSSYGYESGGYDAYGKKEEEPLDYSVLSVAVMTLALILFVEVIRHRLDHEAEHRPFFKAVLEVTYSELATLGLVELFVFLLLRYYELRNKERKEIFAEVHFALFYTAIFNAFQCVLCAFATRRASDKLWVQTEHLELDHYVEIREEFERISYDYHLQRGSLDENGKPQPTSTYGFKAWWTNMWASIKNPGLRSRYLELLVQVRFHELRIHFLENNKLPLTLKVSDYLKRSEDSVLMQMVHVSGTAWILLTGGFNGVYFFMGLVANQTGNAQVVGTAMMAIFFSMLILFIFVCIVLYAKMTNIFQNILETKHISESDHEVGARQQQNLFWFNEPQLVISIIQSMQFGYAIALSIVIMFWTDLGEVEPYYYLLITLACYGIFVSVLAHVLPQFTLCTSLGHLVNKERLNETLAMHRLHEAQRRQKRRLVQLTFGENLDDCIIIGAPGATHDSSSNQNKTTTVVLEMDPKTSTQLLGGTATNSLPPGGMTVQTSVLGSGSSIPSISISDPDLLLRKVSSLENIPFLGQSKTSLNSSSSDLLANHEASNSTLLASLVKMDTSQLRQQLPEESQTRMAQREQRLASRRGNRKKAVSDGVQMMRSMTTRSTPGPATEASASSIFGKKPTPSLLPEGSTAVVSTSTPLRATSKDDGEVARQERAARMANRKANRKKAVSASSVIQAWQTVDDSTSTSKTPPSLSKITEKSAGESTRHRRKKSSSESEVIQAWKQHGSSSASTVHTEGPKFTLKNQINEKTTDDPAELHRRLKNERLSRHHNRRKSVSASAVIQSWKDHSIEDPVRDEPHSGSEDLGLPLGDEDTAVLSKTGLPVEVAMRESDRGLHNITEGVATMSAPTDIVHVALTGDEPAHMVGDQVTVVDLADAKLVPSENEKSPNKKSVGFSSLDDFDTNSLTDVKKSHTDDDSTVDTGKSVGELSDVAEITRDEFETLRSHNWEEPWHVKLQQRLAPTTIKKSLRDFFMSDHYPLLSHVFGSIVVFFLVGMRLEAFNAVTGAYDPSDNTWELKMEVDFFWQVTWYLLFILMSGLVVWAVPTSEKSVYEKRLLVGAVIDLFLSLLCLSLLFAADAQRCCDDEDTYDEYGQRLLRLLARVVNGAESDASDGSDTAESSYVNATYGSDYAEDAIGNATDYGYDEAPYGSVESDLFDNSYLQCCPFWGSRTYGGYGNIEPFTALIGLRVLRFWASKYLVSLLEMDVNKKEGGSHSSTDQEHSSGEQDHHGDGGHGHGHGHGSDRGTAVELWQRALGKYPHIVETYGQFSGELFQAMLGLDIIDDANQDSHKPALSFKHPISPTTSGRDLPALTDGEKQGTTNGSSNPHYKLHGDQYSTLSAECQGIILAGKLGKPVKSMGNFLPHSASGGSLPTLLEESRFEGDHSPAKPSTPANLEFEVDDDLLAKEQDADSEFIAPNARLIRSMRRCDRRLYPLLKEWLTVDVVMTEYEIVYFEVEEDSLETLTDEVRKQREALRLALQATKGGMGLRLMDVAAGRKVVGHLDLSDVTQVHVERDMPLSDVSHLEQNERGIVDVQRQLPSEYWQKPSHIEIHSQSRTLRWAKEKEDRLKLVSIHGTLLLRFFSDLNDVEAHHEASLAEDELTGALKKNIAFQWAQTVAHICGTDQLKQPLPHFGAGDSEELRDYLEVIHHKTEETRMHRRVRSSVVLGELAHGDHSSTNEGAVRPIYRRVRSSLFLGELAHGDHASANEGAITPGSQIPKPKFRHSKSFGSDHAATLPPANECTAMPSQQIPKPTFRYSKSFGDERVGAGSFRLFRRSSSSGEHDANRPRANNDDNGLDDVEVGKDEKSPAEVH